MKKQSVSPTGVAQHFEVNETFFSTTDAKGIISAGNRVFLRTSGYEIGELLGQPHNIIRHSDVPRCVFRLLWETSQAGKPFVGYVKNHARNGNHYWVLAIIVPIPSGYLSVRIKPTTPLLAKVEHVYGELLKIENDALARGQSESAAASASAAQLGAEVIALGFSSYDAFSHHCLNAEVQSRDEEIRRRQLRLFPAEIRNQGSDQRLSAFFQQAGITYERLNTLVLNLAPFSAMGEGIRKRKDTVQQIAEDFRIHALNAHVAAHPLGAEGITIGTVAQFLNGHAQVLAGNVHSLATSIGDTTTAVASIASNISVARIQIEMLLSFIAEIAEQKADDHTPRLLGMAGDLRTAFSDTVASAVKAINQLQAQIPQVLANKEQLRQDIIYLHVAQISGLTEAARLRNADNLQTMFLNFKGQIESAKTELEHLGDIVEKLIEVTAKTPPQVSSIYQSMDLMKDLMAEARAS